MLLKSRNTVAEIDTDETVVFFPTYAHPHRKRDTWVLYLHGWIFESERDSRLRLLLMRLLFRFMHLDKEQMEEALANGRAKAFLAANERGKTVSVRMGDRVQRLRKSRGNGHFHGKLELTGEEMSLLLKEQPSVAQLGFSAVTRPDDPRSFDGTVHLIEKQGVSIISDIDDTIKISNVPNRRALLANTFLHDFQAVPGMAELYRQVAGRGGVFHYVSSSPWQLYSSLAGFLQSEGFPAGPFHLRNLPGRGTTLAELFASRGRNKRRVIERLIRNFPQRKFILVGDSGEKDPVIYSKVARRFREQVLMICIRQVSSANPQSKRYERLMRRVPPQRWHFFQTAQQMADCLMPLVR